MFPILYDGTSYTDTTYGLGVLSDAISTEVEEERNGIPELVMRYPISGHHYANIALRRLIKAKPNFTDDPQLFRIYRITKPISGVVTIYARHISSDLSDKLVPVGTNGSSCAAACAALSAIASPFTITTDKSVTGTWRATEPASIRAWFGGRSGSLLDVYGTGEWYYNGTTCQLLLHRGSNRGVVIRYGKNLTELTAESDCTNMASSVLPYYMDTDGNVITGTAVSTGMTAFTREIAVDFSSDFQETPTAAQLTERCQAYVNANNFTAPKGNITLDFVQIGKLKDRVDLCDTVAIEYEALGVTASVQCIRTLWDVLDEHYIETEFGDPKELATDTIVAVSKTANEAVQVSTLRAAVNQATDAITGQNGGFFVENDTNGDGLYDEVLFLNTTDLSSATKVWRWNLGGLGYSGTGYAGPYTTAIYDGHIVADFVDTGTLTANIIKAGILQDAAGLNYWNMETGAISIHGYSTTTDAQGYANAALSSAESYTDTQISVLDGTLTSKIETYGWNDQASPLMTYAGDVIQTYAGTDIYADAPAVYSMIQQTSDSITAQVSALNNSVTARLALDIAVDGNGDPYGRISANADYIRLDSGQLVINSDGFSLDAEGNAVFSGAVTATALTLGSGVDIGVDKVSGFADAAQDIVEGTVTASYVNALGITAASVAAENITGTTISGKRIQGGIIYYDANNYWNLETGEIKISSFANQFNSLSSALSDTQSDVDEMKIGIAIDNNGVTIGRQDAVVKAVFDNDSLEFQAYGTPIAWLSSDASDGLGVDLIQIGSHSTATQRWIIQTESNGNLLSFTRRAS